MGNSAMISSKAMEFTLGRTEGDMQVGGIKVNNMAMELTLAVATDKKKKLDSGNSENGLNGWTKMSRCWLIKGTLIINNTSKTRSKAQIKHHL